MGLAVVALAVFIGGWILLDAFLAPYLDQPGSRVSFQQIAQASVMDREVSYLGEELCGECHPEVVEQWLYSKHNTVSCEECHAPGGPHSMGLVSQTIYDPEILCATCHEESGYKPADFCQVRCEEHSKGLPCTQCHNPTCPDVAGAPRSIHTVYEGVDCRICHGSQGFHPAPADHAQRPIESCAHCHEQEGETQ